VVDSIISLSNDDMERKCGFRGFCRELMNIANPTPLAIATMMPIPRIRLNPDGNCGTAYR
jgi:hypothetical protein